MNISKNFTPKCVAAIILLSISFVAQSAIIRVSQEATAGAGDFNILGSISTFDGAGLSSVEYYQYGTPQGASYNGEEHGGPAPVSDTTINFFAITDDGLTFYNVHDEPGDGDGGSVRMSWSLAGGDTAAYMVGDDGGEGLNPAIGVQDTSFTTFHRWVSCCTDGFGLGTIDGAGWELFGEFDTNDTDNGGPILAWTALSADGGIINLDLALDRRVRFDVGAVPVPAAIWLFGTALVGFIGFSRRRMVA